MAGNIQNAIAFMVMACRDWSLGYDQSNRWDVRDGGECDCSSLVYSALWAGGLLKKPSGNLYAHTLYTGSLRSHLVAAGWKVLSPDLSRVRPGDVLLNDGHHVAMVVEGTGRSARLAQASIDERGRARGGASGDQTGGETNIRTVYTYSRGWSCILRCPDTDMSTPAAPTAPAPDAALDVDGWAGYLTVRKWQTLMRTEADGEISGQDAFCRPYVSAVVAIKFDDGGSALVRAVQAKVGASVDGYWGAETSRQIQCYLADHGYDVGPCGIDGYFGRDSVRALQRSLNEGKIW